MRRMIAAVTLVLALAGCAAYGGGGQGGSYNAPRATPAPTGSSMDYYGY